MNNILLRMSIVLLFLLSSVFCSAEEDLPETVSPYETRPSKKQAEEILQTLRKGGKIAIGTAHEGLKGPLSELKVESARYLYTYGDNTSIPYLIDALYLKSRTNPKPDMKPGEETARYWANESLKRITGLDFGFVWNDPEAQRIESIKKWIGWHVGGKRKVARLKLLIIFISWWVYLFAVLWLAYFGMAYFKKIKTGCAPEFKKKKFRIWLTVAVTFLQACLYWFCVTFMHLGIGGLVSDMVYAPIGISMVLFFLASVTVLRDDDIWEELIAMGIIQNIIMTLTFRMFLYDDFILIHF